MLGEARRPVWDLRSLTPLRRQRAVATSDVLEIKSVEKRQARLRLRLPGSDARPRAGAGAGTASPTISELKAVRRVVDPSRGQGPTERVGGWTTAYSSFPPLTT